MVSLKWGDVLSTLLPGALALFAIAPYFPALDERIRKMDQAGTGTALALALLIASALVGGILEAFTRITWERFWLVRRCPSTDVLSHLHDGNIELYERGVQGSYKYVTFYANFAWAMMLLFAGRVHHLSDLYSFANLLLLLSIAILLIASHVQWTYYVNYQNKAIRPKEQEHAEK